MDAYEQEQADRAIMDRLVIKPCKCAVCDRWFGENQTTPVVLDGVDGSLYVCDSCMADADGPGRMEGIRDEESLAFALAMDALGPELYADHWLSDESQGVAFLIGRRVLTCDDLGFWDVQEFRDQDAAMLWMNGLEDDGFGSSQEDGWINLWNGRYEASLGGKPLGTFDRLTRAMAAISLEMRRTGFYPNVYLCGEHGPTVRRIDVW